MNVENATLFELILAANYLNIKSLLDITCQAVAEKIKGKTPEQIRQEFNIEVRAQIACPCQSGAACLLLRRSARRLRTTRSRQRSRQMSEWRAFFDGRCFATDDAVPRNVKCLAAIAE